MFKMFTTKVPQNVSRLATRPVSAVPAVKSAARDFASTHDFLNKELKIGGHTPRNNLNLSDVVGSAVSISAISVPLLSLQNHEQIGKKYLFEIKLNQMLQAGAHVDAEAAKNFLVGLLEGNRIAQFPEYIQEKAKKLSEIGAVQQAFADEPRSIFNPKPHGFDLNLGYRPS